MPLAVILTLCVASFVVWLVGCPITDIGVWKNGAGPIDHRCWIWPILLIRYLILSFMIRPVLKAYRHLGNREQRRMQYKVKHAEQCIDLAIQWKKDSEVYDRENYPVSAAVTMNAAFLIAYLSFVFLEEGKPKETHLALRAPDEADPAWRDSLPDVAGRLDAA